jgi:hypothetical protein
VIGGVAVLGFVLGRSLSIPGFWSFDSLAASSELEAQPLKRFQGRRVPGDPTRGTRPNPEPPKGTGGTESEPLLYESGDGTAAQGDGIIAVTGSYGVGTSVLYVIDTKQKQLAVYEARGGGTNGRRIYLVGARRIDLDLRLEGYNDKSEHTYEELAELFEANGLKDPTAPRRRPGASRKGTDEAVSPKTPGKRDR